MIDFEQLPNIHSNSLVELAKANQDLSQRLINSRVDIYQSTRRQTWRAVIGENKIATATSIEGQLYMRWTSDKRIVSIEVTEPHTLPIKHKFASLMNNLDRLSAIPLENTERRTPLAQSVQTDLLNLISPESLHPNQAA